MGWLRMGWLRKLVHHPVRTESGGRGADDESAVGPCERATLSRWEWEGGAAGAVRDENVDDVRKTGEAERAKQDSMATVDDDAVEEASPSQSVDDAAADAVGNPAERGGRG